MERGVMQMADQSKKYMRKQARSRAKAQRAAEKQVMERARQKVIAYDEEGNRIGDDGFVMTRARARLHHMYNACFITMIASFLLGVGCIVLAYFQGQQLSEWELIAYGGNQFRGWSVASMLRVEALYLLFVTAACMFANIKGMAWLYDEAPLKPARVVAMVLGIISAGYFVVAFCLVGVPEPVSLVVVIMALLMRKFIADVAQEKGTLEPAQIARTVVKK